jgi:hypothetical protein
MWMLTNAFVETDYSVKIKKDAVWCSTPRRHYSDKGQLDPIIS